MLRPPYGSATGRIKALSFEETIAEDGSNSLWGNAAFVLGARLAEAFRRYHWCGAIEGSDGEGQTDAILDDLEQGWRGHIAVWRGRIGLVEWNWEDTALPPTLGYSFDAAQLAKQAEAALERLEAVHRELVQAFGRDYWNVR